MVINAKKNRVVYALAQGVTLPVALSTSVGVEIPWKDKIRYLGAFVVQCRKFKCRLDDAKKSFYRAANAVFGENWQNCFGRSHPGNNKM